MGGWAQRVTAIVTVTLAVVLADLAAQAYDHVGDIDMAVDGEVVYSMDEFDEEDTVARYRWTGERLEPDEPLRMSRSLTRIQGGDVADGALWLSTDDDENGMFRVDLASGEVTDLGSAGRPDGEGEGIDADDDPTDTLLHVLVADAAIVPMWVTGFTVTATPA